MRGPSTLYEKFEEVLSNMGIEIEGDSEDGDYHDSQTEYTQTNIENSVRGDAHHPHEETASRGYHRRNSESSKWDIDEDAKSVQRARRNSHHSGDKIEANFDESILHKVHPNTIQPARPTNETAKEDNAPGNVGTWLDSRLENPMTQERDRSISVHGRMRIRRSSASLDRPPPSTVIPSVPTSYDHQEPSEYTEATSYFGDDEPGEGRRLINGPEQRLEAAAPDSLIQIKASIILQDHLRFLAKQQLRLWRDKAVQLREDNIGLNKIAAHTYKKTLLKAVLAPWREQAIGRHKVRTTEIFFAYLEKRAERARNLYLLHTAFTHWSTYANEQVQRTALARRHIIRTRIFNAWRDITAVNELKVRRQILKKFFAVWKRQHFIVEEDDAFALQAYESGLVERKFKEWMHKLREVRASAWWAEGVKRRALFNWIVASHEAWEDHRTAEEARRQRITWNAWSIWRTKTRIRVQQRNEAEDHYRDKLCLNLLKKWRKETRIIPAKTIIQTDVAGRVLRDTFAIWLQRARQEHIAASVDRAKILREALTRWRHQELLRLMTNTINKRIKYDFYYKVDMAGRCSAAVNRLGKKRLNQCFQVWVYRMRQTREQRWEQEDRAQSFAVQRSQNLALAQWYAQMGYRKRLEVAALDFQEPRLLHRVIAKWSEKAQRQQQLHEWAKDAEFYLLSTKTLKRWKASTESKQREKRRKAYVEVRRMIKMNLVQGVLQKWREQARHFLELHAQVVEVRHNRDVILGMEIFDRWRGRAEELLELESLAHETILKKHFIILKEKYDGLQALETEAIITYQERRQKSAIKKWSLVSLQLRAQSNYASDICEKNARKTFRKMLNYWHQKALQRRPSQRVSASESDQLLGTTARAETWSDYGEGGIDEWARGLDEATTSTPIPGYLATPSKVNRAERVVAAAARFSTTPKAPLSTPFERQLRAQYSGGFASLRRGIGRSTLGLGGGFADIPEHNSSMNNERESRG